MGASILRTLLSALLVLFAGATACAPLSAPANPALWRVSDADSDIYLFGTVHILPPELKWRSGRVLAAFAGSDTIVLETPIDAPATADIAALVARFGYNPPKTSLSDLLSAEDRARLIRACARFHIDPLQLDRARPWLAAVQLSLAEAAALGQRPDAGVEHALDRDAQAQHKKRAYFETAEQQIRFFADLPQAAQVQFLRSTLSEIEQDRSEIDVLDRAWAHGDMTVLNRDLTEMIRDAGPDIYAALIRDRNARWADRIDDMMKGSGRAFIAVGAAHMAGPDGVPALLRKKGYKVEGPR